MTCTKRIVQLEVKRITHNIKRRCVSDIARRLLTAALVGMLATPLFARDAFPWETAVYYLAEPSFCPTGRTLQILPIISMVVGGLSFVHGEGASNRALGVLLFGSGLLMAAMNFVTWLRG
jgi:type IV secretory pathway VirB2 component (pilin)